MEIFIKIKAFAYSSITYNFKKGAFSVWSGTTDNITNQTPKNYMMNEKIFILDTITADNCAHLIGDMTSFILNEQNQNKRLMFFINSPGGEVDTMLTIIGLINMARLYNIQIYTFVLGLAGSAASMIAVQGDQRYMSTMSRHFIHFGCIWDVTTKHSEIEKMYHQNKEYADNIVNLYLDACENKLSKTELLKLQSDERGYLSAEQCLRYGLCDQIIENELIQKRQYELKKAKFDEEILKSEKKSAKSKVTNKKRVNNDK